MKTNNDGKYALPQNCHSDLDYERNVLDYLIKKRNKKNPPFLVNIKEKHEEKIKEKIRTKREFI